MNILVSGGAGYLGSVLVPCLLAEGHKVRVLDNFLYGQTSLLDCCHNPNLEIIRGDIKSEETLLKSLWNMDYIIHLAAIVGMKACDKDPLTAKATILDATVKLATLKSKEQRIIYPCTNSGYGIGQPDKEGQLAYCTEETPLNPISLYGRLKVMAESFLMNYDNCISLRLATVFGASPRMRLDLLVNNLVYRAVNDKYVVLYQSHFKRNYIHIRDIAKAFIHCINNWDRMKDQVYNVGLSNCNLSKWELCEEIKKHVPDFYFVEAEIGEDIDKRNYIVDNSKIEKTGFKPDYSLADGIRECIKAYQVLGGKNGCR